MTPIVSRIVEWHCPNCGKTDQTMEARPHSRFHVCPRLHHLTAPMLQVGVKAKVTAQLRQDYEGQDAGRLTLADGKPIQSIITERDNGQDVAVFAAVASASGDI